jgi:hypothetical protein
LVAYLTEFSNYCNLFSYILELFYFDVLSDYSYDEVIYFVIVVVVVVLPFVLDYPDYLLSFFYFLTLTSFSSLFFYFFYFDYSFNIIAFFAFFYCFSATFFNYLAFLSAYSTIFVNYYMLTLDFSFYILDDLSFF